VNFFSFFGAQHELHAEQTISLFPFGSSIVT